MLNKDAAKITPAVHIPRIARELRSLAELLDLGFFTPDVQHMAELIAWPACGLPRLIDVFFAVHDENPDGELVAPLRAALVLVGRLTGKVSLEARAGTRPEDVAKRLCNVVMRLQGKKADPSETPTGKGVKPKAKMPVDARAVGCLAKHPGWTVEQIAEAIGCHPKSLSNPERCPNFTRARRMQKGLKGEMDRGRVDARTGRIEAGIDKADLSYIDSDDE